MADFITVAYVAFSGGADGTNDSWAEGNADWIVDNTAALADQATLVDPDSAAVATSYAMVLRRDPDGTLTPTGKGYHLNDDGQRVNEPPPDGGQV